MTPTASAHTCPVRTFPARKDKTDTHLALELALEFGPEEVVVCGAFGDRIDHNVGLILLLAGWAVGGGSEPAPAPPVRLVGAKQEAWIVAGGRSEIRGRPGDTVSLLPLSPSVTGVSTEGLSYPLERATLTWGNTLGVSNEMTGPGAAVTVGDGALLIVHLRGAW